MVVCASCHQEREPDTVPPSKGVVEHKQRKYKEYEYDYLPSPRGYIRILKLLGSDSYAADIESELLIIAFSKSKPPERPYEALSWCWGTAAADGRIFIREDSKGKDGSVRTVRRSKAVCHDLVSALRALRKREDRYIWIDQTLIYGRICIDQDDTGEKNYQVELMSEIYGQASKVCVWLGDRDRSSHMALEFIKNEVLQLQNFDELCDSKMASEKWGALLDLMQRPWFSRRWVVQEIALANRAVVYCGADKISWKKFAIAVELFVEVETATHRLSEVMKTDPRFYHVPGWFEYVSALGASLLVEATGKIFRDYKPNGPARLDDDSESESDSESDYSDDETNSDAQSLKRNATDAQSTKDNVKDAQSTKNEAMDDQSTDEHATSAQSLSGRALITDTPAMESIEARALRQPLLPLEYLVSNLSIFEVTKPHDAVYALLAISKDASPIAVGRRGFIDILGPVQDALEKKLQRKRYTVDYKQPIADVCKEFVGFCIKYSTDQTRALDIICRPWAPDPTIAKVDNRKKRKLKEERKLKRKEPRSKKPSRKKKAKAKESSFEKNIPLPAWIPLLSGAAFAMSPVAGVHTLKMMRKNADPLVGLPPSSLGLDRNYNAASTRAVNPKLLRFEKREKMNHWSLYLEGFELDKIAKVYPASQGGAIPKSWARAGGWDNVPFDDPPDEFWRTLVADRGRDGRNPPVYYSRACKESFLKGGISSGSVNTTDLINNERCSVIAQFCRRVQAVIWNRCFIKAKRNTLGLASQGVQDGDRICILYGCSVPVVLRRQIKEPKDIKLEIEDRLLTDQKIIIRAVNRMWDRRKYRQRVKNVDWMMQHLFEERMRGDWANDPNGRAAWLVRYQKANVEELDDKKKWYRVTIEEVERKEGADGKGKSKEKNGGASNSEADSDVASESEASSTCKASGDAPNGEKSPIDSMSGKTSGCDSDIFVAVTFDISITGEESIEKLLERRAYQVWKEKQRKKPLQRGFVRENRRTFEAYLHYGRRWKRFWQRQKVLKEQQQQQPPPKRGGGSTVYRTRPRSTSLLLPSELLALSKIPQSATSTSPSNSPPAAKAVTKAPPAPTKDSDSHIWLTEKGRELSDAYVSPYFQKHLAPFKTDPTKDELTPPSWHPTDDENLRHIQGLWTYYEFLGECYVHAMMDGEAMLYQNDNRVPTQIFELR